MIFPWNQCQTLIHLKKFTTSHPLAATFQFPNVVVSDELERIKMTSPLVRFLSFGRSNEPAEPAGCFLNHTLEESKTNFLLSQPPI
jgi:hypothetical protein